MSTKRILIFQGGGALGAYECGAYQALAPHLDNLAVVAGTSIGAINSSLIASHYQTADHGALAAAGWSNNCRHLARSDLE